MNTLPLAPTVLLLVLALGGIWFDVRERRIPNALTVSVLVAALLWRAPLGLAALGQGLTGAGLCFALSLLLFLTGGLGGGDVKMLTAAGALLGPARLDTALLVMALVGGVMAVMQILARRRVRETAANLHTIISTFGLRTFNGWKGTGQGAPLTLDSPDAIALPYGVAIAAGALAGWFLV
ncbi:MAG: prepilin peptidase [Gemmatimonadota bacterium]